jgi:hypothetical protein
MDFEGSLLVEVLGGLATGLVLVAPSHGVTRLRERSATIDLLEDTARFFRDRQRLLAAEMASEFERARDVAMQDSPEYAELIAALKRRALHEYRDEMSRKRRRYRDAYRAEGTIDVMVRHHRNVPTRAIWTYGSAARDPGALAPSR